MHLRGVCLLLLAGVIVTWAGLTRELLFVLFVVSCKVKAYAHSVNAEEFKTKKKPSSKLRGQ